eukprot:Skav218845  [mRNA]  locus=scaffold1664:27854:28579:- [translate_table: standard]
MTFRLVVNGVADAGEPRVFYPVVFSMNFLPDMGACLTALEKKYEWTLVQLEEQSTDYSSQLVRYSSPILDFPPQSFFAKLGSDPVYDLQITGDIFQYNKDSLFATVLEATLDTTWTDPEPTKDWLVRLDPHFYSSAVEIPSRFALDLKLDINTAVLPFMANGVRVKMGFKLRTRFVPYDLKLTLGMETPEDSRSLIWLLVAFFLGTMVAAMSYVYREECGDWAARTFHRGRSDEAIEMRQN